jgi:hypothetical protein
MDPSKLSAAKVIKRIHVDIMEAKDNLTRTKISQATQSNKSRSLTFPFKVGDCIWLWTLHWRHEFKSTGQQQVAKFMPQFDGPLTILETNESASTIRLELSPNSKVHPVFHTSQVLPYKENNTLLFPFHEFTKNHPIINEAGNEEYFVQDIINKWWPRLQVPGMLGWV